MEADRLKWNERYAPEAYVLGESPSRFLAERMEMLLLEVPGKRALDIACGEGRNTLFLAQHGFDVTATDISDAGIAKTRSLLDRNGVDARLIRQDLEAPEDLGGPYDLIINFNFLLRPLFPHLCDLLVSGGIIVVETILDAPSLVGSHNPAYLLAPGELDALFSALPGQVLCSEELAEGPSPTARLIFRKT